MMKTKLQISTLVLLVLVIVLYALTKNSFESHDKIAKDIININTILSSLWFAFTLVFVIVKGIGEKPIERIIKIVRELFVKPVFLIVTIIIFLFANVTLSYQLLLFRQIEFISNEKVVLFESDGIGQNRKIGIVPKNEPINYRLKLGEKHMYYEVVSSGDIGSLKPFTIHFFSKDKKQEQIRIIIQNSYEML